ncbi:hypothetical protein KIN20_015435, partial [Parelaphostrongylus tenuis]
PRFTERHDLSFNDGKFLEGENPGLSSSGGSKIQLSRRYCEQHRKAQIFSRNNYRRLLSRVREERCQGCSLYIRCAPPVTLACHAPKALNLPRYIPIENEQDFTQWLNADHGLVLHKVKDVAAGLVMAPLGCAYDSALQAFIFTNSYSDSVLLLFLPYFPFLQCVKCIMTVCIVRLLDN